MTLPSEAPALPPIKNVHSFHSLIKKMLSKDWIERCFDVIRVLRFSKMAEVQEEAVMTKEHRKILRKHRGELEDNLQPLKLLSYLTDVLSPDDEEEIRAEKTSSEQTVRLLDTLPKKGDKAFEAFVRALEKKQRFLAIPIAEEGGIELTSAKDGCNEHSMQHEHKEILRSSRGMLQEIKLNKILPLMEIVFDQEDIEEINNKSSNNARFDEFIKILTKKEDKAFHHFVNILKITNPKFAEFLTKEKINIDNTDENGLKTPTQVVEDTPIIKLKGNLNKFYQETDQNGQWKRLAVHLQIPLPKVKHSPNQTNTVLVEWSSSQGENATVSELKKVLKYLGMKESLGCLEKDLVNPQDVVDSPSDSATKALVERTEKLSLDDCQRPKVLETIGSLSKENQDGLVRAIEEEKKKMRYSFEIPSYDRRQKFLIRELTKELRKSGMLEPIKWMKKNLPKGITGPINDESMNVREMPYSVRSKLTIELCVHDNWKFLASALGLSNVEINFFDSHRIKNPADEVLKQWETKRNTTVGELYDILVALDMPVIADSAL